MPSCAFLTDDTGNPTTVRGTLTGVHRYTRATDPRPVRIGVAGETVAIRHVYPMGYARTLRPAVRGGAIPEAQLRFSRTVREALWTRWAVVVDSRARCPYRGGCGMFPQTDGRIVIMAYAATFKCTRCGEECEFRAANFAESGLCDECYAAQPDVGLCECCGELSDSRAFATPDDWNSPLWCEACRADDGAAQPPCSYCDAPITDGGGPYCDECLGRFYGRRPCVACGVSVAGWPTACPSCGSEAWTGDTGGAA